VKSSIQKIRISDIIIPEERVRSYQDSESSLSLDASIKKYGVLQPIIVRRKGDKYELIAGASRVEYAKRNNMDEIEAKIYEDLPDADALLINIIENRARGSLDPKEIVNAIDKLTEMGYSLKEIADLTGFSYDYIKQWSRVRNFPSELKQAVITGAIELPVATAIMSIPDEAKRSDAIETMITIGDKMSREGKIDMIEHYYKGKCDICGEYGKDVMKYGEKWICNECFQKLQQQQGVTVTPTPEVLICKLCGEPVKEYHFHAVEICEDCIKRIDEIKRFFAFNLGYKWNELNYETLVNIVKALKERK